MGVRVRACVCVGVCVCVCVCVCERERVRAREGGRLWFCTCRECCLQACWVACIVSSAVGKVQCPVARQLGSILHLAGSYQTPMHHRASWTWHAAEHGTGDCCAYSHSNSHLPDRFR